MTALAPSFMDGHGRRIEYLRISVTDRCNFRCRYCMPTSGITWLARDDLLTYEEVAEVVRQVAPLGLRRIRITGGEPTIRPDLDRLIRMLRAEPQVDDLSLSTNGVHLPRLASVYRAAGLDRVNMSADSLDPARAASIARRDLGFDPMRSLLAAEAAGLSPIKVNVVLLREVNDDEIEAFARLTLDHEWHVRFIELMPVGDLRDLTDAHIVPTAEVMARVRALGPLVRAGGPAGNGPAEYWRLARGRGTIGFITPMTHTYCASCNRVRLTADGRLRTCLFGTHEVDLRTPLRAGIPLAPIVHAALADKPREHELLALRVGGLRALSQVGG